MGIQVILKDDLKNYTNGNEEIYPEGDTVGELLIDITNRYPELRNEIFGRDKILLVLILVDGQLIPGHEIDQYRISRESSITIHKIVGGG